MSDFRITSLAQEPALLDELQSFMEANWPPVGLLDDVGERHWMENIRCHPDCHFGVWLQGELVGVGNCAPVFEDVALEALPDEGWRWALTSAVSGGQGAPPYISALAATVARSARGKRISNVILGEFKAIARRRGARGLIAPVRPNMKHRVPLIPFEDYVRWTRHDGAPFDPWLNTHVRIGGRILHTTWDAMMFSRPVEFWESLTGQRMLSSGQYIVEGALNPVEVDCERGVGLYREPNIWVFHALDGHAG